VRLDRLRAEEELLCDLAVGLTVDDAARDLELAPGERRDPGARRRRRLGAPVDAMTDPAELTLGGVAVADRPERLGIAVLVGFAAAFTLAGGFALAAAVVTVVLLVRRRALGRELIPAEAAA
jgi:hypothetical protein